MMSTQKKNKVLMSVGSIKSDACSLSDMLEAFHFAEAPEDVYAVCCYSSPSL